MEASLPISGAPVSSTRTRPAAGIKSGGHAPSITLPLAFILTGVLALFIGAGWLIARPALLTTYHYSQNIIAVTHLFVLGGICTIVMGAIYQLVPVALETKLFSERLAKIQFVFHLIGFTGMVWMFHAWNMKQVGHFGVVLFVGVGLFVYNIARTLLRVPRWNVTAAAVTAAIIWLSLAVTAGLFIAAGKCAYDAESALTGASGVHQMISGLRLVGAFMSHFEPLSTMNAHAHLGSVGCFTMLIVGVSYKLIPMFTLSEIQCKMRAVLSIVLLNIGLAGAFVSILLRSPWKFPFALVLITALALFGIEVIAILRARKRRVLDWGLKYFLTAIALLIPVSALAGVLAWPGLPFNRFTGQLENLYGFLGLIGFISFAIIGMLYKIVPFLVWFGTYSRHVGRSRIPALADLYSEKCQIAGYLAFVSGLLVTSVGIVLSNPAVVRAGCILIGISMATLAVNLAMMLKHFFRPELKPLVSIAPRPQQVTSASKFNRTFPSPS